MNKPFSMPLKKTLPHLIAVGVFLLIAGIYFAPQFKGYSLHQGDIQNFIGMSKEINDFREKYDQEPLWTNSLFGGMPAYQISTYNSNILSYIESNLFFRLLKTPLVYLFLAMAGFYILLICYGINPWVSIIGAIAFGLSSINILYLGAGHNTKVHAIVLIPPLIGGILYTYRRNILTGAAITSIFVCLQLSANHFQQTYYFLYLGLAIVIFEFIRMRKEKMLPDFTKKTAILILAGLIGFLPSVSNFLVTYEYSKDTTRGKSELTIGSNKSNSGTKGLDANYIKEYSLSKGEVWSIVVPNIKGGASNYIGNSPDKLKSVSPQYKNIIARQSSYWGEQLFTAGAFYFGATIFMLFALGLIFIKDRLKWAFLAASILSAMLSWKYGVLTDIFIKYVPLFSKFRDTKMMLIIAQISLPFIGTIFINELFKAELQVKKLRNTVLIILGVFALFYIFPNLFFDFYSRNEVAQFEKQALSLGNNQTVLNQLNDFQEELKNVRISIFKDDVLRSIFFMAIVSLIVLAVSMKKLKKNYAIIALGLLVLMDIWMVDKRYLNNEKKGGNYKQWVQSHNHMAPFKASVADNTILALELRNNKELQATIKDAVNKHIETNKIKAKEKLAEQEKVTFRELNFATNYRVFSLTNPFANSTTSYYHKSIGGYHGAKLKKYQELIDFRIDKEYNLLIEALQTNSTHQKIDSVLKYKCPTLNMLNTKYIIYNPDAAPILNNYTNNNAWFVKELKQVANADEEILALDKIDPKVTAVSQEKYSKEYNHNFSFDSLATIKPLSYLPNKIEYETSASTEQLAVFSEVFYSKGWNAYIDGELAPYFCSNYILRAMNVPKGKHKIEFRFEPKSYKIGRALSNIGSGLIILFCLGVIFLRFRQKKQLIT